MIWRRMQNFSTNAVAYVLANYPFSNEDYIRDYKVYKAMMQEEK
jgi:hypothetical protein